MPTFFIEQFGCRATQADGAALESQLLQRGYTPSSKADADIVIVNTCTVTAAADSQARDAIRKINLRSPNSRVLVTGCYAQRAPEELAELPGVAWVVGNSHKPEIPALLENAVAPQPENNLVNISSVHSSRPFPTNVHVGNIFDRQELLSAPVFGGEGHHTRPTLKIQDGCNLRCSYCVIPFVRGKSRSISPLAVIQEITKLCATGIREIVLSGINLGTYGRDLTPRTNFQDLLGRILSETSLERLRISSIEPMDVTQDLIALFARNSRLAQHFHMPLQSGCDRILAAMHRWYRAEHYARRVHLLRETLPHAAIGADLIAGFPGETEEEHHATMAFIESLPFTYLHVFSFSQRPGTKAAQLSGQVPAATIKRRARELRSLGEQKSSVFRQSQIGQLQRVLTLRSNHSDAIPSEAARNAEKLATETGNANTTPAISSNSLRVSVTGNWPANEWLNVRLLAENGNQVSAEVVSATPPTPEPQNLVTIQKSLEQKLVAQYA